MTGATCAHCDAFIRLPPCRIARAKQHFCNKACHDAHPRRRISPEQRFWPKVEKTDTCWLWRGAASPLGYGVMGAGGASGNIQAHRFSWQLHNGPVPEGLSVCHRCDNPPCVNPAHLFVGSAKDNAVDMVQKGRHYLTQRTHCPKGHPIDGAVERDGSKRRYCRTCTRACQSTYKKRQSKWTRARFVTVFGETMTLSAAARKFGINKMTLSYRLNKGLTPERAVTLPLSQGVKIAA